MVGKHSFADLMAMREFCMQNLPPYSTNTGYIEKLASINMEIDKMLNNTFPQEVEGEEE